MSRLQAMPPEGATGAEPNPAEAGERGAGAPIRTRVLLVDDQPLVRAGLRVVIEDTEDMEVVGEAGTGAEAVRQVRLTAPDVVVMDIRMPGMDGIEATRAVTAQRPETRVIMLTTFDDDEYVYGSLRAGASGFLVKDMALEDLLNAIRVVAAGDALIAPSVTRRLIETFARGRPGFEPAPTRPEMARVTGREREVLILIGRGKSNTEIAGDLFISIATAKAHVARLLAKLGARDRIQLVIMAYEAGLVTPLR
jgi:DNA-binding NarL/FixJ family response regulator